MNEFQRQHPLTIFHAFSKYLLLLLLPLLRSLLLLKGDVLEWAQGAWFDLVVVLSIVGFGVLQWLFTVYCLQNKGVYVESGVLFNEARFIPYSNLSSAVIETPFYLRPFRIVRVRLDTDSGSPSKADVGLLVTRKQADEIVSRCTQLLADSAVPYGNLTPRVYEPKAFYIAILSLITSDSLTGVLFISAFVSQTGKVLGEQFENMLVSGIQKIIGVLAFNVPPAAAVVAAVILGGWGIAFLINLVNHLRFQAVRQGKRLFIRAGILIKKEYFMAVERVNFLSLRQSLMTMLFGFCSAFINCTGYGKEKNELSVLLPAVDKRDIKRNLRLILPEIRVSDRKYKPPLRVLSRFLIPPGGTVLGFFAFFWLLNWLFPKFGTMIWYFAVMAEIPAIWWLGVKIAAFFHVGIGIRGDIYTFRTTFAYAFFTTVLHKDKISKIEVRQSLFQKKAKCADVLIHVFTEKKYHVRVHNVEESEVEEFLRIVGK